MAYQDGPRGWYSKYHSTIIGSGRSEWASTDVDVSGDVFLPEIDETHQADNAGGSDAAAAGSPEVNGTSDNKADAAEEADQNNNELNEQQKSKLLRARDSMALYVNTAARYSFHDDDGDGDDVELQKNTPRRAAWASVSDDDVREEFRLVKRYEKPPEKQLRRSQSAQVYILGASSDNYCKTCGGRLYEMEKIMADHVTYHKHCFRCSQCQRVLSLSSYISVDGLPYCKSHFKDLIAGGKLSSLKLDSATTLSGETPTTAGVCETKPETDERDTIHHQQQPSSPRQHPPMIRDIKEIKSRFERPDVTATLTTQTAAVANKQNKETKKIYVDNDTDILPEIGGNQQSDVTEGTEFRTSISSNKGSKRVRFSDDMSHDLDLIPVQSSISLGKVQESSKSVKESDGSVQPIEATDLPDSGSKMTSAYVHDHLNIPDGKVDKDERPNDGKVKEVEHDVPVQVADAFAIFRQLDLGQYEEPPPPERKPIRKITPPRQEPLLIQKVDKKTDHAPEKDKFQVVEALPPSLPTTTTAAAESSAVTELNLSEPDKTLKDKKVDQHQHVESSSSGQASMVVIPKQNTQPQAPSDHGSEVRLERKPVDGRRNSADVLSGLPEPGLTKTLLSHWKTMEDSLETMPTGRSSGVIHPRATWAGTWPVEVHHSTHRVSDMHPGHEHSGAGDGDGSSQSHGEELKLVTRSQNQPNDASTITSVISTTHNNKAPQKARYSLPPSLAFTRNQLAKFRQLEALNVERATEPVKHKNFKWGVKEPIILHRSSASLSSAPASSSVSQPPNPSNPSSHLDHKLDYDVQDGREHGATEVDHDIMRSALERFRAMEDPSLPPPAPCHVMRLSASGPLSSSRCEATPGEDATCTTRASDI